MMKATAWSVFVKTLSNKGKARGPPPNSQRPRTITKLAHLLTVQTAVGTTADYQIFAARWRSKLPFCSENFNVGLTRGIYGNLVVAHFLPVAPWAPEQENAYRFFSLCLQLGKVFPPLDMWQKAYILEYGVNLWAVAEHPSVMAAQQPAHAQATAGR